LYCRDAIGSGIRHGIILYEKNHFNYIKKLKEIEELENQLKVTTIELNEGKKNLKKTREELFFLKISVQKPSFELSRAAI